MLKSRKLFFGDPYCNIFFKNNPSPWLKMSTSQRLCATTRAREGVYDGYTAHPGAEVKSMVSTCCLCAWIRGWACV